MTSPNLNPADANVYIDFGGGWRYGFPRLYVNPAGLGIVDYLRSFGVPEWLAVQEAGAARFWTHPTGSIPLKGLTDPEKKVP